MDRARLRVAEQVGDLADRDRRIRQVAAREILPELVDEILERQAVVGEPALEAALAHVQRADTLESQVAARERQLRARSDLFRDVQVLRFPWTERYDAARYVALLSTYSGHIALPDTQRQALLNGIARAIEVQGAGYLIKRYVAVLFLARKGL